MCIHPNHMPIYYYGEQPTPQSPYLVSFSPRVKNARGLRMEVLSVETSLFCVTDV